jgi:hypothetical protein
VVGCSRRADDASLPVYASAAGPSQPHKPSLKRRASDRLISSADAEIKRQRQQLWDGRAATLAAAIIQGETTAAALHATIKSVLHAESILRALQMHPPRLNDLATCAADIQAYADAYDVYLQAHHANAVAHAAAANAELLVRSTQKRLRQLNLFHVPSSDLIDAVSALPHLSSCALGISKYSQPSSRLVELASRLLKHDRLTELAFYANWRSSWSAVHELTHSMQHLRRLHVAWDEHPSFDELRFDTFYSRLPELRCITLQSLAVDKVPEEQLRSAFAALLQLHTLHVRDTMPIERLLAQLPAAPSLTQLYIAPRNILTHSST